MRQVRTTILVLAALLLALFVSAPAAQADPQMQVCAPKRCITVPYTRYCPVSRVECSKGKFIRHYGYCSSSVGCFTIGGVDYTWAGGPTPTWAQRNAAALCFTSIGGTVVAAGFGGPIGLTAFGATLTSWGCASI